MSDESRKWTEFQLKFWSIKTSSHRQIDSRQNFYQISRFRVIAVDNCRWNCISSLKKQNFLKIFRSFQPTLLVNLNKLLQYEWLIHCTMYSQQQQEQQQKKMENFISKLNDIDSWLHHQCSDVLVASLCIWKTVILFFFCYFCFSSCCYFPHLYFSNLSANFFCISHSTFFLLLPHFHNLQWNKFEIFFFFHTLCAVAVHSFPGKVSLITSRSGVVGGKLDGILSRCCHGVKVIEFERFGNS